MLMLQSALICWASSGRQRGLHELFTNLGLMAQAAPVQKCRGLQKAPFGGCCLTNSTAPQEAYITHEPSHNALNSWVGGIQVLPMETRRS